MFRAFPSSWNIRAPTSPRNEGRSRTAFRSQESDRQKYTDGGDDQYAGANFLAAEPDVNVKKMPQCGSRDHCREQNTEEMSQPNFGRVHPAGLHLDYLPIKSRGEGILGRVVAS
jgi:hypothetical protein